MRHTRWILVPCLLLVGCPDPPSSSVREASDAAEAAFDSAHDEDLSPSPADASTPAHRRPDDGVGEGDTADGTGADASDPDLAPPPPEAPDMAPAEAPVPDDPDPDPDPAPPPRRAPIPPSCDEEAAAAAPWVPDEPSTRNQRIDPERITRVLFIGDGILTHLPVLPDGANLSELATFRGRLTRRLDRLLLPLTSPAFGGLDLDNWYRGGAGATSAHEEDFSVCAHPSATWTDLDLALMPNHPDGHERQLSRLCLADVPADAGGVLLVIVAFGAYGPVELNREDPPAVAPPRSGDPEPLGLRASALLGALRAYFEGRGYDEVLIVASELPAWRGEGRACSECRFDPEVDGHFAAAVARFNRTFVAEAAPGGYDVVFADALARDRGARCLTSAGDEADHCGALPAEAVLRGDWLDIDPLDCCWTAGAACAEPDLDGHLGLAQRFEQTLKDLAQ